MTTVEEHTASLVGDALYLDRCQHDTPRDVVSFAWHQVMDRRDTVGSVVDFGAGDARFATAGKFDQYVGYEIDARRAESAPDLKSVSIRTRCAFSHRRRSADICIGNPPFVRNQDLPAGWRGMAAGEIADRTGVTLSGLANAWQYFLMLALWSVKPDGGRHGAPAYESWRAATSAGRAGRDLREALDDLRGVHVGAPATCRAVRASM